VIILPHFKLLVSVKGNFFLRNSNVRLSNTKQNSFLGKYEQKLDRKHVLQFDEYIIYKTSLRLVKDQLHINREAICADSS
jgi:hypothetical protein